jgi:hypothetical protein
MGVQSIAGNRLSLIIRAAALTVGLSTYLISPDDVVWRFIKTVPNARVLEHAVFVIAAVILGFALLLKVKASAHLENQGSHGPSRITAIVADLLQAIGIGSLLPLPGFLLLVLCDVAASLLLYSRNSIAEDPGTERSSGRAGRPLQAFRWRDALAAHLGLCLAFLSMAIFSATLIDRVADVLFGMTALVSVAANARTFLKH